MKLRLGIWLFVGAAAIAVAGCSANPAPIIQVPSPQLDAVYDRANAGTYIICYKSNGFANWTRITISLNGQEPLLLSEDRVLIWKVQPGIHRLAWGADSAEILAPAGSRIVMRCADGPPFEQKSVDWESFTRQQPLLRSLPISSYRDISDQPPLRPLP